MCFTAPLCHHRIFSEQLFQLRLTGVSYLNFPANLFSCAIETAVLKISDDDIYALRYDLSY